MKNVGTWMDPIMIAMLALGVQTANATPHHEIGDAGQNLATAQNVPGGITSISGELGIGDPADVYRFAWNGGLLEATIFSNFDPMLFVFDETGSLLAFNDDYVTVDSHVLMELPAGSFLLGIDNFPGNFLGDLSGFSAIQDGYGAYTVTMTKSVGESVAASVPEPSALALVALGILALGVGRKCMAMRAATLNGSKDALTRLRNAIAANTNVFP